MEKIKNKNLISPQEMFMNFLNLFSKLDKLTFLFSFLVWIVSHAFVFFNDYFVYDSVRLFDLSVNIDKGRFLVYPILAIFANCQIPWIIGLFSGIMVSISIVLIRRILNITKIPYVLLLAATIITFPVIYNTNAFLSSLQVFYISLFFSVLSVYYINKETLRGYIIAFFSILISLACYQAYMPFAVCLFLLPIFVDALENKDIWSLIKKVIITAMIFIASTISYYLIWQILLNIFNVVPNEYRGESITISSLFSTEIFERIKDAYFNGLLISFKGLFYHGELPLMVIGSIIKFCIPIIAIILTLIFIKKNKTTFKNILLVYAIIFGLPLGISLLYVFSPFQMHTLMVFPVIVLYFIIIVLLEKLTTVSNVPCRALKYFITILLIVSVSLNFVLGNASYSIMSSLSKSALSFATRVTERVESTTGVDVGTKVCFVSNEYWFYSDREEKENEKISSIDSFSSFTNVTLVGVPYMDALIWYINDNANYMELEYSYQDLQDGDYANNEQVQQLQPFPAKNCSVWVNDTLVVRL